MDNEEKKELLKKSEVSLQIDTYDDIFSDFDPRPYSQRALSFDFLEETKRAIREYKEGVQLRFLVPNIKRDQKKEELIKRRLKDHFKKHMILKSKEKKSIYLVGAGRILLGLILMFIGAYLSYNVEANFWIHFVTVVVEIGGWINVWEGSDEIFVLSKKVDPEYIFNNKMMKAEIIFNSY